ncbi:MAG: WD40 repeat domain-containing protein, partial [Planctomycetota bacterium]
GTVKVWDLPGRRAERTLDATAHGRIFAVALSTDGRTGFSGGDDGVVVEYDLASGAEKPLTARGSTVTSLQTTSDGTRLVVGTSDGALRVVDLGSGRVATAEGEAPLSGLACSPDRRRLLSSSLDGMLRVLDLGTLAVARRIPNAPAICPGIAFVDDHRFVAPGNDGSITLWDADTGTRIDRVDLRSARDWGVSSVGGEDGRSFFTCTMRGVVLRFVVE